MAATLASSPCRGLNVLLKSRNTALKPLHPLSRCAFVAYLKHETASTVRRFALYAKWYGSLDRAIMDPILLNSSDSGTLRGTGLHAIGRSFGQSAVDDFSGRGVILVVRQETCSTSVLIDSWNKSVKTAHSSLAAYLGRGWRGHHGLRTISV